MLIPVILSGDTGTRLWPVSREAHPKPFMRIGRKSLLLQTYEHAQAVAPRSEPLSMTNRDYYLRSQGEVSGQAVKPHSLLEPVGRNTKHSRSLQMHRNRSEHWVVVSGTANTNVGENAFLMSPNQPIYIPIGTRHRGPRADRSAVRQLPWRRCHRPVFRLLRARLTRR